MNTRTRNAISRRLGVKPEHTGGGCQSWIFYRSEMDGRALYFSDEHTADGALGYQEMSADGGTVLQSGEMDTARPHQPIKDRIRFILDTLHRLRYSLTDCAPACLLPDDGPDTSADHVGPVAPAPAVAPIAAAPLPVPLVRCTLVRERVATDADIVDGARTAARIVSAVLGGADREHFVLIALDARRRALGVNIVSIGTVSASLVHPREVFKPAILLGACAVVVAHNHPSGNTDPSAEDREVTRRLARAGELLGIPVADHVIVGDGAGEYFSFRERGLL